MMNLIPMAKQLAVEFGWRTPAAMTLAIPGYYLTDRYAVRLTRALPRVFGGAMVAAAMFIFRYLYVVDQSDPNLLILARTIARGGPVYPPPFYGLGYGPITYWILMPFSSPSSARVLLVAMVAISFVIYGARISRYKNGWLVISSVMGFAMALCPAFFGLGPNPPLLALGLIAAALIADISAAAFGVLVGLMAALRINQLAVAGLIGLFPGRTVREQIVAGVVACAVSTGIYGVAGIPDFVPYLRMYLSHGLDPRLLILTALSLGILWTMLLSFTDLRMNAPVVLALLCTIALGISAGKNGAGMAHLLGIAPLMCAAAVMNDQRETSDVFYSAVALTLLIPLLQKPGLMLNYWHNYDPTSRDEHALLEIERSYGATSLAVLPAGARTYPRSFLSYVVVVDGGPVIATAFSMMDVEFAGVDQTPLAERLTSCPVEYIAIPDGEEPLSLPCYYDNRPVFAESVRKAFKAEYRFNEAGRCGTFIGADNHDPAAPAPLPVRNNLSSVFPASTLPPQ